MFTPHGSDTKIRGIEEFQNINKQISFPAYMRHHKILSAIRSMLGYRKKGLIMKTQSKSMHKMDKMEIK